ncbi:hypothetical protein OKA05_23740 [Luteolibacter arcticus]|uniref:Uncharacterized protein n=2 Tax=Luteolibacter arcticus TaxID=1581411 RepID=A0ABT3GPX8_9BACT|nr:hypothetical protein [Luteolibacter arcticus]
MASPHSLSRRNFSWLLLAGGTSLSETWWKAKAQDLPVVPADFTRHKLAYFAGQKVQEGLNKAEIGAFIKAASGSKDLGVLLQKTDFELLLKDLKDSSLSPRSDRLIHCVGKALALPGNGSLVFQACAPRLLPRLASAVVKLNQANDQDVAKAIEASVESLDISSMSALVNCPSAEILPKKLTEVLQTTSKAHDIIRGGFTAESLANLGLDIINLKFPNAPQKVKGALKAMSAIGTLAAKIGGSASLGPVGVIGCIAGSLFGGGGGGGANEKQLEEITLQLEEVITRLSRIEATGLRIEAQIKSLVEKFETQAKLQRQQFDLLLQKIDNLIQTGLVDWFGQFQVAAAWEDNAITLQGNLNYIENFTVTRSTRYFNSAPAAAAGVGTFCYVDFEVRNLGAISQKFGLPPVAVDSEEIPNPVIWAAGSRAFVELTARALSEGIDIKSPKAAIERMIKQGYALRLFIQRNITSERVLEALKTINERHLEAIKTAVTVSPARPKRKEPEMAAYEEWYGKWKAYRPLLHPGEIPIRSALAGAATLIDAPVYFVKGQDRPIKQVTFKDSFNFGFSASNLAGIAPAISLLDQLRVRSNVERHEGGYVRDGFTSKVSLKYTINDAELNGAQISFVWHLCEKGDNRTRRFLNIFQCEDPEATHRDLLKLFCDVNRKRIAEYLKIVLNIALISKGEFASDICGFNVLAELAFWRSELCPSGYRPLVPGVAGLPTTTNDWALAITNDRTFSELPTSKKRYMGMLEAAVANVFTSYAKGIDEIFEATQDNASIAMVDESILLLEDQLPL